MGIYDFNMLSEHDQYDTVFTKGQFVETVTKDEIKYAVYAVQNQLPKHLLLYLIWRSIFYMF